MVHAGPTFGVDIGGTKVLGLAVEPATGAVSAREQVPTPHDTAALVAAVTGVLDVLARHTGSPRAIGLGVPGLVDRSGVLRFGPNVPGVEDLDLAAPLRRRYQVPVTVDNDAACAALAEHRLGAARGHDHAVVITQGTGIGAGIVVEGRLLRGAHGFAGEPGHVLIDPAGPRCACGAPGHWEALASGAGLANLARLLLAEGRGRSLLERAGGDPAALRGEDVVAAALDADPDAAEVLHRFARWVAHGLAGLVAIFDPGVIVLGGGLAASSGQFLDQVRAELVPLVLGGSHRPSVPVVTARFGPDAGAIGAAVAAADSTVA